MSATTSTNSPAAELLELAGAIPEDAIVEPTPDPLLMMAADANDLVGRIRGGQGGDLNNLVQRAIAERSAADGEAHRRAA